MKKENVKRFWEQHKNTIKKAVILITVPAVVIGVYVVVDKILDKKTNSIFEGFESNTKIKEA